MSMKLVYSLAMLMLTVVVAAAQSPSQATFQVEVTGSGPPMILIPGLTSPGSVWTQTVEHYRTRYALHVLTLSGFAGVEPTPDPSLTRVRDDLIRYIRQNQLDRPVLVGHSLGGFLAYWVAARAPENVRAVVSLEGATYLPALFDTAATPEVWNQRAEGMRSGIAAATPESFRRQSDAQLATQITDSTTGAELSPVAAKSDPLTTAQFMYELYTTDIRTTVTSIRAPVLLLVGTAGVAPEARAAYVSSARRQVSNIRDVEVREVPTARHFIQLDAPSVLHSIMDEFLARLNQ